MMKKNVIALSAAALMLSLTACGTTTDQGIAPNDMTPGTTNMAPGGTEVPRLRSTDSEVEFGRTANHYGTNNIMQNGRYVAYPDGGVSPMTNGMRNAGRTIARDTRTAADRTRIALDDMGSGIRNASNDIMG